MLVEVTTDVYFIAERLCEIDKNYFTVYNTATQKFEIHNREQQGNTYCLSVPFETLDCRTLELVQKTKIENINKIIEEIDKSNIIAQQKLQRETLKKAQKILN
ncbi:MAG: hypothetical protein PHH71_00010 [Clostridia bacterium]|jgi:hypothetical protein|nr:hypothetical protein [Clostridia bacterium]MDD3231762.1 hypothetical protein [Clostridia bacterium]MDD3862875.1 hypothetical protein [Clostridia bacterium]MDD4408600.1 hypothetical protein [Clostridia bacterium]